MAVRPLPPRRWRGVTPVVAALGKDDAARANLVWVQYSNGGQPQISSDRAELDAIPPTTPGNLQAKAGDTAIALTWVAATDHGGIQSYAVFRAADPPGPYQMINAVSFQETTYTDVALDTTPYFYKVYAVDGTGNHSADSNLVSATATVSTNLLRSKGRWPTAWAQPLIRRDLAALATERTLTPSGLHPIFRGGWAAALLLQQPDPLRPTP